MYKIKQQITVIVFYLSGISICLLICYAPVNAIRPSGLKYEKAKEWRIPCVNAQWLCDILLGHFDALRQIQHSRYSQFNLPEPLAPNPHFVHNLLSKLYFKFQRHYSDAIAGRFPSCRGGRT